MTIEIKEKGTKQFYKEVVNVITQYEQLLYAPGEKLKDNFMRSTLLAAAMLVIFVLSILGGINGAFDTMKVLAAVFAALASVATIMVLLKMKKSLDSYIADDRPSVVTLDENGVEIEKTGAQAIRLAWENVEFVRSFEESTCFFSKIDSRIVLSVTNAHKKEIMDYIKDNNIDVKVIQ